MACLHLSYERRACTCLPHMSPSSLSQTLSVTSTLAPYFDFCKRRSFIFAHSRLHSLALPCCARSPCCVWEGLFYLYRVSTLKGRPALGVLCVSDTRDSHMAMPTFGGASRWRLFILAVFPPWRRLPLATSCLGDACVWRCAFLATPPSW